MQKIYRTTFLHFYADTDILKIRYLTYCRNYNET
jgi:hypothetical protein